MPTDDIQLIFNPSAATIPFDNDDGVFLGNGKLGIMTQLSSNIDVQRVFTSCDVTHNNGLYKPNVVDVFNPCSVQMFNLEGHNVSMSNISGSLLMENGCYTSLHTMSNLDDGMCIDTVSKLYTLRHAPYTILQTIEITPTTLNASSNMDLMHEVYTKPNIRSDAQYDHTYYTFSSNQLMHQFYGSGTTYDGMTVAFASVYLFEGGSSTLRTVGSSRPYTSSKDNNAYFMMQLEGLSVGATVKLHILTTIMTDQDYPDPKTESRAVATSIALTRNGIPSNTISWLLGKHVNAWSALWKTKISITPRSDASEGDITMIGRINKLLNVALYNIYSSIRENFNVDLGDGIPILDSSGMFLYEADLWLMPTLLVLKPNIAKTILEYRFKTLIVAQQLASAYGLQGAKYPYITDVLGYRNNLYFMDSPDMYIFNSALIAVHTWNYYRISKDSLWLREKGYKILQEVATCLVDVAQEENGTYEFYFENTVSLNSVVSNRNNTFTNNLCKLALRYAIEASHELRTEMPTKWSEVYEGIQNYRYDTIPGNVLKFDQTSETADTYEIAEVLFNFCPMLWEEEKLLFPDRSVFSSVVKSNLEYYGSKLKTTDALRPSNTALKAILAGVHGSTNSSYITNFNTYLQEFLDNNVYGPWYYMRYEDKVLLPRVQRGGITPTMKNSIYTNAMFLAIFIQGLAQLRISGGVGENKFYYEDLKLSSTSINALPASWNIVSFNSMGAGNENITTDTRQSDPTLGDNLSFPHPPDFHIYTP